MLYAARPVSDHGVEEFRVIHGECQKGKRVIGKSAQRVCGEPDRVRQSHGDALGWVNRTCARKIASHRPAARGQPLNEIFAHRFGPLTPVSCLVNSKLRSRESAPAAGHDSLEVTCIESDMSGEEVSNTCEIELASTSTDGSRITVR